ncbi:hypothetical protein [Streptomyces sp. NPDC059564]|uniref:hypothetical protein n=1 Tax=Streptomyces sp. NPDC059564 TaxID=3346865 RepID=UPI0036BD08BC
MVTRTPLRNGVVPAAPIEVWQLIGDFGALKDPAAHAHRYCVEAPAFPVRGYEATLPVHPHEAGAEVRWQGTYEAESADADADADAVAQVEQLFGDGTFRTDEPGKPRPRSAPLGYSTRLSLVSASGQW